MTSLATAVVHRALSGLYATWRCEGEADLEALCLALRRLAGQILALGGPDALRTLEAYQRLFLAGASPQAAAALRASCMLDDAARARVAARAGTTGLEEIRRARAALASAQDDAVRADLQDFCTAMERLAGPEALASLSLAPTVDTAVDTAWALVPPATPDPAPEPLGPILPGGRPGISLVTCCMNRNQNLLRALPSWLVHPELSEVVIVDWSSDVPVAQDLAAAGVTDPRIRILRVEGEPRWVLSYAFNLGFRCAEFDTILKADADIVLAETFFALNRLEPGMLIAGNWREAGPDQPHVNGFFLTERSSLHRVAGFNEHITTYGWDDEDLYARLMIEGVRRVNVAPGTIHHLPHSDAERLGDAAGPEAGGSARDQLARDVQFLIRRNRAIAALMPDWNRNAPLLPFNILRRAPGGMVLRREGWVPSAVPGHMIEAANQQAWRELLSWRLGRGVLALDAAGLQAVLDRPGNRVSALDVEIARRNPDRLARGAAPYLVIALPGDLPGRVAALPDGWARLAHVAARAAAQGWAVVLRMEREGLPDDAPEALRALAQVPLWEAIGHLEPITLADLARTPGGQDAQLDLTEADLAAEAPLADPTLADPTLASPPHAVPRARLFLDTQHGLGNRLRAMGSAAAIARATDRDLVVIWEADDHCDCRLGDLFDYDGAVLDQRFLADAEARGLIVQNYMPHEPGAQKDAPIRLEGGRDTYVRSAFVLNHPASTWDSENVLLQAMRPVAMVRDLVAGVRHPNDLAAHVRMQGGAAHEHLPYERADNWTAEDHAAIALWRSRSHYGRFLDRIDALLASGEVQTLFLAADLPESYEVFQHHYGERLAWLPRRLYDRSTEQLLYGLADAILLSRAPRLLGSTWSSFSELAMRLAPNGQKIEMSGTDF